MYNRYVPQADGSFRRNRVAEPQQKPHSPPQKQESAPCPQPQEEECHPVRQHRKESPPGGFLRQLLPKDFDTGDLIVILLLLLMAGDCEEDRNHALLTIALYFMM